MASNSFSGFKGFASTQTKGSAWSGVLGGYKWKPESASQQAADVVKQQNANAKGSSSGLLHGIEGFVSHLGSDAEAAATGFIPGTLHMLHHPIAGAEAIANDYKTRYYDAIKNHGFGGFLHDVYLHPLSYMLDAATLASGGLTLGSKLAAAGHLGEGLADSKLASLARPTTTELRSSRAIGSDGAAAPTATYHYSARPMVHLRQHLGIALARSMPDRLSNIPVLGESSKATRAIVAAGESKHARAITAARNYINLTKNIKEGTPMATASVHFVQRLAPHKYLDWLDSHGMQLPEFKRAALSDPKANALYYDALDPTVMTKEAKQLRSIHAAVKEMSKHEAIVKGLGAEITGPRAILHHRLMAGARVDAKGHLVMPGDMKAASEHIRNGIPFLSEPLQNLTREQVDKIISGEMNHPFAKNIQEHYSNEMAKFSKSLEPPTHADVMHSLAHEGELSSHFDPLYFPDKPAAAFTREEHAIYKRGVQKVAANHLNEGTNFRLGMLADNPHMYSTKYINEMRAQSVRDAMNTLEKYSLRHTGALPKGYVWLKSGQTELERIINKYVHDEAPMAGQTAKQAGEELRNALTSNGQPELARAIGMNHGLIVPKKMVDQLITRHSADHAFLNSILGKSYGLWKRLVLTSPRFVANTFVGNGVLAALHQAGPKAIPAMYNALLRDYKPEGVAALMGKSHIMTRGQKLMDELLPEHSATFARDIVGDVNYKGGFQGKMRSFLNLPFAATHNHEQWMRRAVMLKVIRNDRQVRAYVNMMRKEGYKGPDIWGDAARRLAKTKGGQANVQDWGREIDNVMGNYRSYSHLEQQIRKLVPFYGWNRHAVRSAGSLAFEKPARALLADQAGRKGSADLQKLHETLPQYMETFMPAGVLGSLPGLAHKSGVQAMVDTKGMNPLATVSDTLKAVEGLAKGKPGGTDQNTLSLLNPAIAALYGTISGQDMITGKKIKGGPVGGLVGNSLSQIAEGLPPVKLGEALTHTGAYSQGNPNNPQDMFTPEGHIKRANIDPNTGQVKFGAGKQTMLDTSIGNQLWNLLGVPVKEVNRATAKQQRLKQNTQSGDYFHQAAPRRSNKNTRPAWEKKAFSKWVTKGG